MFNSIKDFVSGNPNQVVTKEEVRSGTELLLTSIQREVIPSIKASLKSKDFFNSENAHILATVGASLRLRSDKPEDTLKELLKFFEEVSGESSAITDLVDTQMSDKMFLSMATAQELAIMRLISDLSSVSLYMVDLLYYVVMSDETAYPKIKVAELKSGVTNFTSVLRVYIKDFSAYVSSLGKVAKSPIEERAPASMVDKFLASHGVFINMPATNGFVNNPIYHIRIWLVDRDVRKYEALKDKKKLLELKLLNIKMRNSGHHDGKTKKQIEYYEERIAGIEKDIKDSEED